MQVLVFWEGVVSALSFVDLEAYQSDVYCHNTCLPYLLFMMFAALLADEARTNSNTKVSFLLSVVTGWHAVPSMQALHD